MSGQEAVRTGVLVLGLLAPGVARGQAAPAGAARMYPGPGAGQAAMAAGHLAAGLVVAAPQLDCGDCLWAGTEGPRRVSAGLHGLAGGLHLAKGLLYAGLDQRMAGDLGPNEFGGALLVQTGLSFGAAAAELAGVAQLGTALHRGWREHDERVGHPALRFSVAVHGIGVGFALLDTIGTLAPGLMLLERKPAVALRPFGAGAALAGRF